MLRAAADQYFLENGATSVLTSKIIGPGTYIARLLNVAGETYPETIEKGKPIVIRRADGSALQFEH
jgi:type IV pilus assembly protein PilA